MEVKKPKSSVSVNRDQLVLYYHPFSFYSQKVLFAFYEKNVECDLQEVDITNGKQCSNWFLELNPRFDVPVLQNGSLVIPSSNQIINYLEENFDGEDIQKLLPRDVDKLAFIKILTFHRAVSRLPIGAVSLGSFIHNGFVKWPKLPFVGPLRRGFLESEQRIALVLKKHADENQLFRDTLEQKAKYHHDALEKVKSRETFIGLLTAIDTVLDEIESELRTHSDASADWLCCDRFTIADVGLGVLMHRLDLLGFAHRFWKGGKRPYLERYFTRIQSRPAFKRALPSTLSTLKVIWKKTPLDVKVSISVAVVITGIIVSRF